MDRMNAPFQSHQGKVRKRSSEEDEEGDDTAMVNDDSEEEEDEDEYLPDNDGGASGRPQNRHSQAISEPSNTKGREHFELAIPSGDQFGLGRSASTGSRSKDQPGGSKSTRSVVLGPDGRPPPKKKRRRQALSCTGEYLCPPSYNPFVVMGRT